ncbi:MAG: hypothetical protein FJY73_13090 [Candidatus Eisenbacteria bacterium]|nr:hypothetical protein [Candidatus Eisenbacteria bacterium]
MTARWNITRSACLSLLVLVGCAPSFKTLEFENTNPVRIERSVQELDVASWIGVRTPAGATVALLSLEEDRVTYEREEKWEPGVGISGWGSPIRGAEPRRRSRASVAGTASLDWGVRRMIEDNLISSMVSGGYRVLERDPDMLANLLSESSSQYSLLNPENLPTKRPSRTAVSEGNQIEIRVSGADARESPHAEDPTVRTMQVPTELRSADRILAYRVLECGIVYRAIPENRSEVERLARTRLHCRLEDAKTGEILRAGLLDSEISDVVPRKDMEKLKTIHYDYFDFRLPNFDVHKGRTSGSSSEGGSEILEPSEGSRPMPARGIAMIVGGLATLLILSNVDVQ